MSKFGYLLLSKGAKEWDWRVCMPISIFSCGKSGFPSTGRRDIGSAGMNIAMPKEMIMKKCPFCAEEIQDEALKCKHCGEFMDASGRPLFARQKIQWYFRTSFIIIAVCSVGPLALPLIWWRPQTTRAWKIGLTIGILFLTWIFYETTMRSLRVLEEYYKLMNGI